MAKGSTMLKVVGILMIVFGAIGLIITIVGFGAVALLDAAGASMGLAYFGCVLALLSAVAELVTGILGVINCDKPEKAQMLIICAIVIVVLSFLGNIIVCPLKGMNDNHFLFIVRSIGGTGKHYGRHCSSQQHSPVSYKFHLHTPLVGNNDSSNLNL